MVNYKSFKLPGNGKLRVRADAIVATVSSKGNRTIDIYVSGVPNYWHIPIDGDLSEVVDYVWDRKSVETEGELE